MIRPTHRGTPAVPGEAVQEMRRLVDFRGDGYDKGRSVLWQAAWVATMNLVFVKWWCPARVRTALLRLFGARVGARVLIRHRVRVLWPWKLEIGDDTWIGEGAWLLNLEHVHIGSDVCISQEAFVCTGSHDHRDPTFAFDNAPIAIGDGAWIAARAIVLRGASVSEGEVVPAGSVRSRADASRREP